MKELNECVARGAEWLDTVHPGWERRIDLANLELSVTCRCVLGQIFKPDSSEELRDFRTGWSALRAVAHGHYDSEFCEPDWELWITRHGFERFADVTYDELDEAWIAVVKERFASGNLSDA